MEGTTVNPFKKAPVATLISIMTAALAVAVYLQSTGLVTGQGAVWLTTGIGVAQVLLGLYARQQVTPVADPKSKLGLPLYPAHKPPTGSL